MDNYDYGVSMTEIAEQFQIPPDRVEAILAYAKSHRIAQRERSTADLELPAVGSFVSVEYLEINSEVEYEFISVDTLSDWVARRSNCRGAGFNVRAKTF